MRLGWDQVSQACKKSTSIAKLPSWDTCKIFIWPNWNPMHVDRSGDFLCVDCKHGVSFATCKAAWLWLHHNIYACSPAKRRRAWVTEQQRYGTGYNIQPLRISLLSLRSFERGAYGHLSDEGKAMKPRDKSCPLLRVLDSVVCFSPHHKVMCWLSGPNRSYNWSVSDLSDLLDFCWGTWCSGVSCHYLTI